VKILWASPLPPTRSGISDYAVELLAELSRVAEVRVVSPPGWRPDGWPLADRVPIVAVDARPGADEVHLVHLGNNPYHSWLLERLDIGRTVVVLHDVVLHHLLVESTLAHGESDRFRDLLGKDHAAAAPAIAAAREVGVTGRRDPFLFPARRALVASASAVVVHSRWAADILRRELPEIPTAAIGLAVADPGSVDRRQVRRRLGIASGRQVLMHLGFLTAEKGMLDVLTALATALRVGAAVQLIIIGEGREQPRLRSIADALGITDRVSFTGWLADDEMRRAPAAADLGVVLRTPSAGETSAAAVRFLACGTPVAVTGLNQFLEWPEAAAPRICPGAPSAADLSRLLVEAATDPAALDRRRAAARAAYEARHRPPDVARQLVEALESMGRRWHHAKKSSVICDR